MALNIYEQMEKRLLALEVAGNPFSKEGMTELRCCCNPGKLLGYLPYNGASPPNRHYKEVIFKTKSGEERSVTLHSLCLNFHYGYAFKSDDRPMSYYESIPGFVPATLHPE